MQILKSAQAPDARRGRDRDTTSLSVLLVGVGSTVVAFVGVAFQTGTDRTTDPDCVAAAKGEGPRF
jgi:hypothetical protein